MPNVRFALIVGITPLFIRATLLSRGFAARYGMLGLAILALALLLRPLDMETLQHSIGTFAAVVGLLAFLPAMAQPLRT